MGAADTGSRAGTAELEQAGRQPGLLDRLHADLAGSAGRPGYTAATLRGLLGPVAHGALGREQRVPAVRVCERSADPVAALAQAFLLGVPVSRRRLDAALPATATAGLEALGLVSAAGAAPGDPVRGRVELRPYEASDALGVTSGWLASDAGGLVREGTLPADHVVGAGGASLTLARWTPRGRRERVLDLGTGTGVQALHAARHARAVTVTDISRRALAFARLNWGLNASITAGVALRALRGSLLEPVRGERFDLVVSNPPFVINPPEAGAEAREYRDGGMPGDDLVASLVRRVGEVLEPGGVAQLVANWEHHEGLDWRERLAGWVAAAGLDAWVVQREVQDPAEYAELWIRDGGPRPRAVTERLYAAYLDDFQRRGVCGVGFGLLTLRRPLGAAAGPLLRRFEEQRGGAAEPMGDEVERTLAAHDWLAEQAAGSGDLLDHRLRVAGDVVEERHHVPGREEPELVLLRRRSGLARVAVVPATVAGFVGACDGELTVGRIAGALAALLGRPDGEVREELLRAVPGLMLEGFLTRR